MASKSVKFEISLEKLVVKFEGDIEFAERFQGEITGALNALSSTQTKLLSQASPPQGDLDVATAKAKRRRRRRTSNADSATGLEDIVDGTVIDDTAGEGSTDASGAKRTGAGTSARIVALKDEGYFATKRTLGAIKTALAAKGFTYKSGQITPVLVQLTQTGVLKREKSPQNQWIYFV
jgi:hypothetical protein